MAVQVSVARYNNNEALTANANGGDGGDANGGEQKIATADAGAKLK